MLRPRKAMFLSLAIAASTGVSAAEFKANEVLVKYKPNALRVRLNMNSLYDSVGVAKIKHFSNSMSGFELLTLNEKTTVAEALSELRKSQMVAYAQPNYILHTLPMPEKKVIPSGVALFAGVPCLIPGIPFPPGCEDDESNPGNPGEAKERPKLNPSPEDVVPGVKDPQLDKAYGLAKIQATDVWADHNGSRNFIVADIDTGIDYNGEDLSYNIWRNPNPSDKNDVAGFDFIHNDGLPFDDNQHGTHTAGTIGAVGNNGIGVSGVVPRVSLMSLKFLSGEGSGTTADAIRAIDYAIDHGAKVLSNSWGGKGDSDNQALRDAIERAKAKDVLFIAAAGNDGSDNDGSDPSYPAAFNNDNLITVAATDENDGLAYFSNYGKKTTHVAAPGVNVYSTVPGNKYKNLSGTSMACPHVAGAAALIWSKHPSWSYKRVKEVLMSSVDPLPVLAEKTISGGRINLKKAMLVVE